MISLKLKKYKTNLSILLMDNNCNIKHPRPKTIKNYEL